MKSNPFKSFQVFTLDAGYKALSKAADVRRAEATAEKLTSVLSSDPRGATWETIGLVPLDGVSLLLPSGPGVLLGLQFNARILPGKVRDEHLKKRVAELEEQEGRKVGKKEYAQLRDDVEAALLPVSHIRRTVVPVLITNGNRAVIFTTSAKKGDDVMSVLIDVFDLLGTQITFKRLNAVDSVSGWLGAEAEGDGDSMFMPTANIVIKANEEGGATFRVKDRDVESSDVQKLLDGVNDGTYRVIEMGLIVMEGAQAGGIEGVSFTLNEKLVFKGLKFPDLALRAAIGDEKDAEFHGVAELAATTAVALIDNTLACLGGEFGDDDL